MIRTSLLMHTNRVREDDLWTQAAVNAYSIALDRRIWKYIPWIKRYLEVFREAKNVTRQLDVLQTPCQCYQSKKDELVSSKSANILRKNQSVAVKVLENSGHFYYDERDYARLTKDFRGFAK